MHQHAVPTPYSPALVETLQTIIARGQRARTTEGGSAHYVPAE